MSCKLGVKACFLGKNKKFGDNFDNLCEMSKPIFSGNKNKKISSPCRLLKVMTVAKVNCVRIGRNLHEMSIKDYFLGKTKTKKSSIYRQLNKSTEW